MDGDRVRKSSFNAVSRRKQYFTAVLPAELVRQATVLVQQATLLALSLARPGRMLRLRLSMERVYRVGVVHVRVGVLRLRIDGLVGRREVRRLEVRVWCMGEGRCAAVLTYATQLR